MLRLKKPSEVKFRIDKRLPETRVSLSRRDLQRLAESLPASLDDLLPWEHHLDAILAIAGDARRFKAEQEVEPVEKFGIIARAARQAVEAMLALSAVGFECIDGARDEDGRGFSAEKRLAEALAAEGTTFDAALGMVISIDRAAKKALSDPIYEGGKPRAPRKRGGQPHKAFDYAVRLLARWYERATGGICPQSIPSGRKSSGPFWRFAAELLTLATGERVTERQVGVAVQRIRVKVASTPRESRTR